ncbi:lysylphosphatidylglycerol synthase transmembrane domain-containing protein [Promineifilum sp.]|uniref:lysylphosphatidylglycerol synthase transmembrane domain-containing protein n=1 Tax=Promineifilum sp. TaxID=2664178 RepID=UPI0035B3B116
MITEKAPRPSAAWRRYLPWLNLALAVGLVAAGLWYLSARVSLAAIGRALAGASMGCVALAVAIVLLTIALKAWRWQLMLSTTDRSPLTPAVPFRAAFWATALGQYVNLVIPFLRLGEVARVYALNRETGASAARALGTLVVEKTLDLIFFGLTILFVLPFVILPDFMDRPGPLLFVLPALLLAALYLLAYRTEWVIGLWRRVIRPLPERAAVFLLRVAVAGLEGLAALRDRRRMALLVLTSLVIAALSVALPYALGPALGLPLSVLDAALIHIGVTIAITPPSTPAKLGVFNGAAALLLWQFGLTDETAILSYTILFYLVAIGPQIVLGLMAASRTKWRWSTAIPAGAVEGEQA